MESQPVATNGVSGSAITADEKTKSVSSLEPSPPTPKLPNEIGFPPTTAEMNTRNEDRSSMFQSKRLCERWLDNLFMVLYEVITPLETIL